MISACATCHDPLPSPADDCGACARASERYHRQLETTNGFGDADNVYHELAHFLALYKRRPRSKPDMRLMNKRLDELPIGRAQLHELHTIALQHAAYKALGWQPVWQHLLDLSWMGLQDVVGEDDRGGRYFLRGHAHALHLMRNARIAPRLVTKLVRLLQAFRQ